MTQEWTDSTIVKARLKGTSFPTDAEVNAMIEETEGFVEAMCRESLKADETFAEAKHGILREAVTNIVCTKVIAHDPSQYSSSAEAALAADIFWANAQRALKVLEDSKCISWLKGLA